MANVVAEHTVLFSGHGMCACNNVKTSSHLHPSRIHIHMLLKDVQIDRREERRNYVWINVVMDSTGIGICSVLPVPISPVPVPKSGTTE
jgi:hypothetical protein